jgi:hypothetical protein
MRRPPCSLWEDRAEKYKDDKMNKAMDGDTSYGKRKEKWETVENGRHCASHP